MFTFVEYVILLLSILTIYYFERILKSPSLVLNVYRKPGPLYYVKVLFMYTVLSLRKLRAPTRNTLSTTTLERPQTLRDHKRAVDAVYFSGSNRDGDYLIVALSRRHGKLVDGFLYLKLKSSGFGILESLKLPGTSLYQKEEEDGFSAEDISITAVEPMKKWKISYRGKLKHHEDFSKKFDVYLDVEWTSDLPYFNFDSDMDSLLMASCMAKEEWSRNYFDILKAIHQTHYEQYGQFNGTVMIEETKYSINMDVLRDHSFGLREFRNFHRYGLHFFTAENGDRFTVGSISMPICFSNLTLGYVYSKQENKIHPVSFCDLQLYQHGELSSPPLDYAFSFRAGGKMYHVQVIVVESPAFFISKDFENKVYERMSIFKVNGLNGWGIAEWLYRNIEGKEAVNAINDE